MFFQKMNKSNNFSEQGDLWSAILSEDEDTIVGIQKFLDPTDLASIIDHLKIMATEAGWHPSQRKSASFAMALLEKEMKK